ncbi:uncharacterized protein [Triticum aestivum]|uniref:uncharacterized protein n=1 Tax=Triticum aestivum TaxID=4565 RepID=UPI001D011511|nr:uncharacterized protein LOC123076024 [Triticum aestivum]
MVGGCGNDGGTSAMALGCIRRAWWREVPDHYLVESGAVLAPHAGATAQLLWWRIFPVVLGFESELVQSHRPAAAEAEPILLLLYCARQTRQQLLRGFSLASSGSPRPQEVARLNHNQATPLEIAALARSSSGFRSDKSSMPDSSGATVLDDLPEWLVVEEILVRLPTKDVLRCRAVRKSWRAGTSADKFVLDHHRRQPSLPIIQHLQGIYCLAAAGDQRIRPVLRYTPPCAVLSFRVTHTRPPVMASSSCRGNPDSTSVTRPPASVLPCHILPHDQASAPSQSSASTGTTYPENTG